MKDKKDQFDKVKDDPDAKVIALEGKKKRDKDRKEQQEEKQSQDNGNNLPEE